VTERSDLASFLRARREQLHPADVGLRDSGSRRTPGLRREEVATLAGVSVDYLMRLEQGRDLKPSGSVIAALASALQLSDSERMHLGRLAAISRAPEMCPGTSALVFEVAPTVRTLLDRLQGVPAFVLGPANDVLAWNPTWETLVEPMALLDERPPNLVRYIFTNPKARSVFVNWTQSADEQVSRLREASLRWGEDAHYVGLVDALMAEPEFATRWSAHGVAEKHRGTKRLAHPEFGELRVSFEVLHLLDDGEQRLVTWLPADEASAAAIDRAVAGAVPVSPAQLRVVREA